MQAVRYTHGIRSDMPYKTSSFLRSPLRFSPFLVPDPSLHPLRRLLLLPLPDPNQHVIPPPLHAHPQTPPRISPRESLPHHTSHHLPLAHGLHLESPHRNRQERQHLAPRNQPPAAQRLAAAKRSVVPRALELLVVHEPFGNKLPGVGPETRGRKKELGLGSKDLAVGGDALAADGAGGEDVSDDGGGGVDAEGLVESGV